MNTISVPYRELVVTGPNASVIAHGVEEAYEDSVQVEIKYSGISLGTEMSIYRGTNPRLTSSDDAAARVPPLRYPVRSMGYMQVGRIVSAPRTRSREGEVVALRSGHRTMAVQHNLEDLVSLPEDVPAICGVWVGQLLPICANGLLYAAAEATTPRGNASSAQVSLADGVRDRNVVVSGAGVIGLLLACWTRQLGARAVVVVDASAPRLETAAELGLEVCDADDSCHELTSRWNHGGRDAGADVVFQCRGRTVELDRSLRTLRPGHAVIDLAFYQDAGSALWLGKDFHHLGLTIRAAQIGNRPRGLQELWPKKRLIQEGLAFLGANHRPLSTVLLREPEAFDRAPDILAKYAARRGGPTVQPVLEMDHL